MNKIIFIIGCFCILCGYQVQAQDNILYPLISKGNQKAVTLVGNTLQLRTIQTRENKVAQLFFFKRTDNGRVRIISAANHQLYLKRDGGNISLVAFNNSEASKFEWDICYAGYPYCVISDPGNSRYVLQVQGDGLAMGTMPMLSNNPDIRGDNFRFTFGNRQNLPLKPEQNTY